MTALLMHGWAVLLAAISAGAGAAAAVVMVARRSHREGPFNRRQDFAALLARFQDGAADELAWSWLDGRRLLLAELGAAVAGGLTGYWLTLLPALGLAGAALCLGSLRVGLAARAASLRRSRQDGVLEAVRSLRQLLETGGVSVAGALEILAARGPAILREHFRKIVQGVGSDHQARAWSAAREAVGEPLFDLLSAAVLVQRPAGGELAPLFSDLEEAVTAVHEVEREAEALQVQARSAAALILALPLVFLTVMSALRSPYLAPYRQPVGELFLLLMLAVMASSYAWIRHWLRLPGEPRLRLRDA